MQSIKVLLLLISSCGIVVIRSSDVPEIGSIEKQIEELQISINQMFMEASEQMETLTTEIRAFKQSLDSLVWYAEDVKSSVNGIARGNELLLRNVTVITQQSDEIVANQQYCANHEALKNLFYELKPKCAGIHPSPTPPSSPSTPSPSTPSPSNTIYASCQYAPSQSGVYRLAIPNTAEYFEAYCEMEEHGGRWLAFQSRQDGSVNFNRSWADYETGFGDPYSDYWLGLDNLYRLTAQRAHELMITLEDFNGNKAYEKYSGIKIDQPQNNYKLYLNSSGTGTAGDSLYIYRGEDFATWDTTGPWYACAQKQTSGFWHYSCDTTDNRSNLNGAYNVTAGNVQGIWWNLFRSGVNTPLKRVRMMIREVE